MTTHRKAPEKGAPPEPAPNTDPAAIEAHKARKALERKESLKGVKHPGKVAPGNAGYPVED